MSFAKLPREFFKTEPFCYLSSDAKIMYTFLADRTYLSKSNGEKWRVSNNEYYVFCKLEETMRILNCGHDKATRIMRELEQCGLINRIPQRMGPYKIIVDMTLLSTK